MNIKTPPSVASVYESMKTLRQPYVDSAILSAAYTIPQLFLNVDEREQTKVTYKLPDSSIGASGLNNLAATLLVAIFPTNMPFFRTELDQRTLIELKEQYPQDADALTTELEQSLRRTENQALEIMEAAGMRADIHEILRQFLLGQVLISIDVKTNKLRGFKLNQYGNIRAANGQVTRYVIEEYVTPLLLDDKILEEAEMTVEGRSDLDLNKDCPLYTDIRMVSKGHWETVQELNGKRLPSTLQKYTDETLPYFDIAFNRVLGSEYGSGFIEGVVADLKAVNGLRRALIEGAMISSRTIFAVDPSSMTSPEELVAVPNGGFIRGRPGEVTTIRVDKEGDYAVTLNAEAALKADINTAFMSQLAARRNAERVTAAEFTSIAEEINASLGGTFSRLADELQKPIARLTLQFMQRAGFIKSIKEAGIKTSIITGISALGRGNDRVKIQQLLADFSSAAQIGGGLEAMGTGLNVDELRLRIINANSINASGLLKSEDTKAQEQEDIEAQQAAQGQQQLMDTSVDLLKQGMAHPEGAEAMNAQMEAAASMSGQQEQPQQQ